MAIVQNDHFAGGRFTDGHPGASQAITLASVLDLILPIAELEREVFGQGAGVVVGEDQPECLAVMEHRPMAVDRALRSEEHTSELQSRGHLVCRLRLGKKKV